MWRKLELSGEREIAIETRDADQMEKEKKNERDRHSQKEKMIRRENSLWLCFVHNNFQLWVFFGIGVSSVYGKQDHESPENEISNG